MFLTERLKQAIIVTIYDQKTFLPFAAFFFLFYTWQGRLTWSCDHLTLCQAEIRPSPSLSCFSSQSWHTPGSPKNPAPSPSLSFPEHPWALWTLPFWEESQCIYFYLRCQKLLFPSVHPSTKNSLKQLSTYFFPENSKQVWLSLFSRAF